MSPVIKKGFSGPKWTTFLHTVSQIPLVYPILSARMRSLILVVFPFVFSANKYENASDSKKKNIRMATFFHFVSSVKHCCTKGNNDIMTKGNRFVQRCYSLFIFHLIRAFSSYPASILHKSTAGPYRSVSYPDGPITARYRFM